MKRSGLKYKCFLTIAAAMSFMVFAMPILAQQDDFMAGRMAGEQAARIAINGSLWFIVGCLAGIVGVVVAYVVEPNPPAMQLLGKSPEYVASYTDAYKATAKGIQTNKALTGCLIAVIAQVALGILVVIADEAN